MVIIGLSRNGGRWRGRRGRGVEVRGMGVGVGVMGEGGDGEVLGMVMERMSHHG